MAKFTIELGSMVSAHKHLMEITHNAESFTFKGGEYNIVTWHDIDKGTLYPNQTEALRHLHTLRQQNPKKHYAIYKVSLGPDPLTVNSNERINYKVVEQSKTERKFTYPELIYNQSSFDYLDTNTPNNIIEEAGVDFFDRHIGKIPSNYTDNAELNSAIDAQLKKTFLRHFYGWEIGQENPEYWFLLARDFFDEYMPIFVKTWQQLIVDNSQWITNLSHTTGHYTGNVLGTGNGTTTTDNKNDTKALAGVADTPQNGLDFRIDESSENPTAGYNFRYSSNVSGNHGHDTGHATSVSETKDTQNSENNSTQDSQGRNQTIASLINELDAFTNGAYQNLFTNAKSYGLFMQVF